MAISQKRAPLIQEANINRIVQQIYTILNEIINAVNQGDTSTHKDDTEGKVGDIRIQKDFNNEYFLEAKTNEGWIQSTNEAAFPSGFKFKERIKE